MASRKGQQAWWLSTCQLFALLHGWGVKRRWHCSQASLDVATGAAGVVAFFLFFFILAAAKGSRGGRDALPREKRGMQKKF
jgi:hypothetical protein